MMLVFRFEIRSLLFFSRLFLRVVYLIHLYLGTRAVINPGGIVIEIAKQATKAPDKTRLLHGKHPFVVETRLYAFQYNLWTIMRPSAGPFPLYQDMVLPDTWPCHGF